MNRSSFNIRESQATAKHRLVRGKNNLMKNNNFLKTPLAITSQNHSPNRQFAREQKISLLYDRVAVVL